MSQAHEARLRAATAALALLPLALFLATALARLRYPYELHWMEGMTLEHVARLARGEPLFVAPSLAWVPSLYTPLYYYVAAAATVLLGPGFLPLRAVSLLATLAMMALLALLVRHETRSPRAALLAVGALAATYPLSDYWFDQGRIDSLFLLLVLLGVVLVRLRPPGPWGAVAGIAWGLAYLTKQLALAIALPMVLVLLVQQRQRALWLVGAAALTIAGTTLWLDGRSGGWYRFYTIEMVATPHHLLGVTPLLRGVAFWTVSIARQLWLAALLSAIAAACYWRHDRRTGAFYASLALGMVGLSWYHRLQVDTELNGLMPAHLALALGFGLGWACVERRLDEGPAELRRLATPLLGALALLFFVGLSYNPLDALPTAADRAAGDALVARVRAIEGDVFIPYHNYLARLAGKPPHAHAIPMSDLLLSRAAPREALIAELRDALATQRYAALLLDEPRYLSPMGRDEHYRLVESLFPPEDGRFLPVSGPAYRPTFLWEAAR